MYKEKLLTVIMIALFLSLCVATNISAATITVPTDYLTIQQAVDASSAGDTIYIKNGIYYVPNLAPIGGALVKISKDNLTLEGQSRDGVILTGRTDKSGGPDVKWIKGIHVEADNVTIKNLTVRGFKGGIGQESHGFGIVFRDFEGSEIDGGRVENVRLLDNGYALAAYLVGSLVVSDSIIHENESEGIYLYSCWPDVEIAGNIVSDGSSGISLISSMATLSRNDVSGTTSQAILLNGSSHITATENTISDNTGWGVMLIGASQNIQLLCNTIADNGMGGIQLTGTITNSRFDFNNIYGNTGFGAKNSTGVLLNFENNWWGDSTGPYHLTTNPSGLGDRVSNKIDYRPWLNAVKDMYWKDYNGKAPGGYMPDIDQNQNFDGIAGIEKNYCSPTAEADSLWWLAQKHGLDLGLTDVNGDGLTNVLDLVQELAVLMKTNQGVDYVGTLPQDQVSGINSFLLDHNLDNALYVHKMDKPTFAWIEQEVKSCQDVKLDLGFYKVVSVTHPTLTTWKVKWARCGGHAVDVAGVDSNNSIIALSDPDADNAEVGLAGIVRGPNHIHPTGHNDAVSASHDIFFVGTSKSPGGSYGLTGPYWSDNPYLCNRYQENNGPLAVKTVTYSANPLVKKGQIYTEIETAVVVSPKINMVIQPNGGEIITSGSAYTIKWSAPAGAVKYRLMYTVDNGTTWEYIKEEDTDPDSPSFGSMIPVVVAGTSYVWTVPAPPNTTNTCLVKVIAYDASDDPIGADTSDSTFTIKVLDVTSPDGGEILTSRDVWFITWKTYETIRDVATTSLSYSLNGGTNWTLIKTLTGDPQWYSWTVPNVATIKTHCKVKVELKDSTNVIIGNDVSGSVAYPEFTIKPLSP